MRATDMAMQTAEHRVGDEISNHLWSIPSHLQARHSLPNILVRLGLVRVTPVPLHHSG